MAISSRSALTVPRTATVMDTIRTMAGAKTGSVLVVDGDRLLGIFSERDVMLRVVLEGRHPEYTTVEEVKHHKPHFDERTRQDAVQSVPEVDCAVLGDPVDKYKIIKEVNPKVICLGYDQKVFVDKLAGKLKEFGLNPRIVRIIAFKPEIYKSSIMKKRTSKPILIPKTYVESSV